MPGSPNQSDEEMHHHVDWMRPSDRPIVREIADYGGWIKPGSLSLNLPYTRKHIADRCRELSKYGLLEKHPEKAAYRPTELSYEYLSDELGPSDLENQD